MRRPRWLVGFGAGAILLAGTLAAAREPRTIKLHFPPFTLPPGGNVEQCALLRVPLGTPFDLASYRIKHRGRRGDFNPIHFLVYLYRGENLAAFGAEQGQVVASRACLDLGPPDRDHRMLFASGILPTNRRTYPPLVSLRLDPVPDAPGGPPAGLGFVISSEWINRGTRPRRASSTVILQRVGPKEQRRPALPFEASTAELGLSVPPGEVRSTEVTTPTPPGDVWAPAADACVILVAGRFHKRGRFLGVDLLNADGTVRDPGPAGYGNPIETSRRHLFGASDYTDTSTLDKLATPLLVRKGEALRYACWQDNGVTTVARVGCEESPGVPPGTAAGLPGGGPAKPCAVPTDCPPEDAAYPGRHFTGACVPAMLVAGTTPDDEVCAVVGAAFDAVAGAPAGQECPVR